MKKLADEERERLLSDADDDFDEDDDEGQDQDAFARLVESSLSGLREGEVVVGRVVEVTPVGVVMDIGYKAEGEIPLEEFQDAQGRINIQVGDEFEVMIEARVMEGDEETVLLSRRRAGEVQAWERIEKAYKNNGTVKGTIVSRVKGGLKVDVGVPAFLPGSQVDLRPVRDLDGLLGQKFDFKVLKYSRRRRNVVLSRRVILEERRESERDKLLSTLQEGQQLQGIVKNVVKYGAFIDLGGMDGLLHVSDMSWGRIQHPGDLVRVGDELTVKVLKFDKAKGRISLGLKQLTPDPWANAADRYPVGSLVKGRVVNLVDYGVFLELEPGLEGLVHASEMTSPEQGGKALNEGQTLEAVVLSLDRQNRKLALSLKRVEPDPWLRVVARYPVGAVLEARIKELAGDAALLRLEAELDGVLQPDSGRLAELTPGRLVRAAVTGHEAQTKRVLLRLTEVLD